MIPSVKIKMSPEKGPFQNGKETAGLKVKPSVKKSYKTWGCSWDFYVPGSSQKSLWLGIVILPFHGEIPVHIYIYIEWI